MLVFGFLCGQHIPIVSAMLLNGNLPRMRGLAAAMGVFGEDLSRALAPILFNKFLPSNQRNESFDITTDSTTSAGYLGNSLDPVDNDPATVPSSSSSVLAMSVVRSHMIYWVVCVWAICGLGVMMTAWSYPADELNVQKILEDEAEQRKRIEEKRRSTDAIAAKSVLAAEAFKIRQTE